jgi:hypothetical protein
MKKLNITDVCGDIVYFASINHICFLNCNRR